MSQICYMQSIEITYQSIPVLDWGSSLGSCGEAQAGQTRLAVGSSKAAGTAVCKKPEREQQRTCSCVYTSGPDTQTEGGAPAAGEATKGEASQGETNLLIVGDSIVKCRPQTGSEMVQVLRSEGCAVWVLMHEV